MKSTETYVPRPVVMYFFVAPSQRLVRWNYVSIKDAKKVWHPTRLANAAGEKLQPWIAWTDWRRSAEGDYTPVYVVKPSLKPILRYQGGDPVPGSDIGGVKSYKRRRRNRKYKEERHAERTVGRRGRQEQVLDEMEPRIRARLRVHRLYYEDAWVIRDVERNWKGHRRTQWR